MERAFTFMIYGAGSALFALAFLIIGAIFAKDKKED